MMTGMVNMYEIYQRHRAEYDQLVQAEDYLRSLPAFLRSAVEWTDHTVLEGGTGTGRVTELYAADVRRITCLDLESHMLEAAAKRLADWSDKITYQAADNLTLPQLPEKADLFIEGWAWGHSIVDHPGSVEATAENLFENIRKNLLPDSPIILIETMGTNRTEPGAPLPRLEEFYALLQSRYGMTETVLATDYRFPTVQEAADTLGFFFGAEMKQDILKNGSAIIPEWTGIWTGRLPYAK
jgi:SAM-dependent methyltransferase